MKHWRRRGIVLLIIVGLIIAASILFSKLSSPVSAPIKVGQEQLNPGGYDIDLTPVPEKGTLVSFNYPKALNLTSTALSGPPSLEDFVFRVKDVQSWLLGIDITKDPTNSFSYSSAYTLRLHTPQQYQESVVNINGQSVPIFTDTSVSSFSKVAFLLHDSDIATVSLTGDDTSGLTPLQTSFNMVLNSWQWTQ